MKKHIIGSIALILSANCFGVMVSAQDIPYEIEYKYSESRLTVSGISDYAEDVMAIQILKDGISFDSEYQITDLLHANQFITAEDKKFIFNVEFDAADSDYEAGVSSSKSGEKTEFSVHLLSKSEFEAAYSNVNTYVASDDFSGFCTYINKNADDLNLLFSLTKGKTLQNELTDYYTYLKANPLQTQNEIQNGQIYKTYITAYGLNEGSISNIDEYMGQLYFEDENVYLLYKDIAEDAEIQEYFTSKMTKKGITDLTEFSDESKEALILTTVKYSDGSDDIKNVLTKYGNIVGISGTASDSVYRKLAGNDYEAGSDLKAAYERLKDNGGVQGNGSGNVGGNSGGNGGGGNGSSDFPLSGGIAYNPAQDDNKQLKIVFNDIDGVLWASEAILALADKGIISGKDENIFAPDDAVTREEFTKMLIGAMGLSDAEYGENIFADVPEGAWYLKYVNIASKYGIVEGKGNGSFGVGENITRQDMAVMLYRAMQSRNADVNASEVTFADSDLISDYAKNAVSALSNIGAINGVGDNRFDPLNYATRAQAAKVIYSIMNQF